MFSCRMKLEKLLCLKYFGSTESENLFTYLTMKAVPSSFQAIMSSDAESHTMSYVFTRKEGTWTFVFVAPLVFLAAATFSAYVSNRSPRAFCWPVSSDI